MSTAGAVCAENATQRKTLTQNERRISSTTASPENISQLPIPTKFIPLLPSGEKLGLVRGCSLHWSHPHSGSFLVSAACREMTKKGYNVFVAYADPEPGEQGVILRVYNFVYCGMTNATEKFKMPDGKVHDARQAHCLT